MMPAKDTVILSLKDYNDLRDFRDKVMKGQMYVVKTEYNFWNEHQLYFFPETDDALTKLGKTVETLEDKNDDLRKKLKESKESELLISKSLLINMNWWQFRKWKRQNK